MLYQLPNGKTINISVEAFLRMSDDDLRYLNESNNIGCSYDDGNPFAINEDQDDIYIIDDVPLDEIADDLDISDDLD
jgi:hypothetical protein